MNTLELTIKPSSLQGKYAKAEPLYLRAIGIEEKTLGSDHFQVGVSLNSLAGLFHAQVKFSIPSCRGIYSRLLLRACVCGLAKWAVTNTGDALVSPNDTGVVNGLCVKMPVACPRLKSLSHERFP